MKTWVLSSLYVTEKVEFQIIGKLYDEWFERSGANSLTICSYSLGFKEGTQMFIFKGDDIAYT